MTAARPLRPVNPRPFGPVEAGGRVHVRGGGRRPAHGGRHAVPAGDGRHHARARAAAARVHALHRRRDLRLQAVAPADAERARPVQGARGHEPRARLQRAGQPRGAVERRRDGGAGRVGTRPLRVVRLPRLPLRRPQHRRAESARGASPASSSRGWSRTCARRPARRARSCSCTARCSPGSRATSTRTTPQILTKLFAAHGVQAVFAAHDHFYYEEEHDGVRYVTVGGAGGPLYTQPPAGGFSHYVLVSCGPAGVDYNVVEPNRLELTVLAGDDGLEPVTTARLTNTTDRDLVARGLRLRVPRLGDPSRYRVSAAVARLRARGGAARRVRSPTSRTAGTAASRCRCRCRCPRAARCG